MPTFDMPVVVGRGLDRATGLAATQPQFPIDVRNAYARDAKMALCPGLGGTPFPAFPWGDDTLALVPVKATLELLAVLYERLTREVRVYRIDTTLGASAMWEPASPPADGVWGTLDPDAEFPVVSAAEADGLVFLAHDEPQYVNRLATVYYTPDFAGGLPGSLTTLTQDLNGDGMSAPVYFRGVYAYLEYMWGWAYGSETPGDEDRGDIIRFAKPGQPLVWVPSNYFLAGVKKDPIVGVVATGNVLAICKADEAYRIFGTSPDDFGIEFLDRRYGAVSSRVLISTGTRAFTWASDGAREVLPTGTVPIAQPLELISPLPNNFPSLGPERLAFAAYDLRRYLLGWFFPNTESGATPVPGFLLSLWNPDDPRWTFREIQIPVTCAGALIVRDTGNAPTPPTGYVSAITAEDVP